MRRYYMKALGSVCYDKIGITYPDEHKINFRNLLSKIIHKPKIKWVNQFNWNTQPQVLTFEAGE